MLVSARTGSLIDRALLFLFLLLFNPPRKGTRNVEIVIRLGGAAQAVCPETK